MGRGRNTGFKTGNQSARNRKSRTIQVIDAYSRTWSIVPGVIDSDSTAYFTAGQCHAMSMALEEYFGWPAVVIEDGNTITHCMNRVGDQFVDITGLYEEELLREIYGEDIVIREAGKHELENLEDEGFAEPDFENACLFTEAIKKEFID